MAPPEPLRKLSRLIARLPEVAARMAKGGVPAAVLRWRVAPLPLMVRFSLMAGSAMVRTYRHDAASSSVSLLVAPVMAAARATGLHGTMPASAGAASAGWAAARAMAAAKPAAAIFASLRHIYFHPPL